MSENFAYLWKVNSYYSLYILRIGLQAVYTYHVCVFTPTLPYDGFGGTLQFTHGHAYRLATRTDRGRHLRVLEMKHPENNFHKEKKPFQ